MYTNQIRNLLVSISTGGITLMILLIAPLGLAAVIVNTLLVTIATYGVSSVADRVIRVNHHLISEEKAGRKILKGRHSEGLLRLLGRRFR
jgi:hypothetical protein